MRNLTVTLFNHSVETVKLSMRYNVAGHANFKATPPILYTHSGQLLYPSNATDIYIGISFLSNLGQYVSIFTDALLAPFDICYKVSRSAPNLHCQRIPCPNFNNLCSNRNINCFER